MTKYGKELSQYIVVKTHEQTRNRAITDLFYFFAKLDEY